MTTVYKRFSSEITELIDSFQTVTSIKENNGIKLILTTENNVYSLFLSKEYPFRIPMYIEYNGINWKYYLYKDNTTLMHFYLKKYYNLEYYNILDHDNWTPSIKISKIISILNNSIKIKNEIIYRLLCFKIKYKYKCYDAYIESYLFYYDKLMYF